MAENKPVDTPPETGTALKVGDLRKMITDVVAEVTKGITKPEDTKDAPTLGSRTDRSASIQALVQAEIDKIKAKETEDAEKADIQTKLTQLAEATKEQTPVERRRVHKIMGWGE